MSYYQQQPYQQPPPVKRRGLSTTWIIVIVSVSVAVVLLAALALTEPTEPSSGGSAPASGRASCGDDKRDPCAVTPGQAFTIARHETQAGWKVVEQYGQFSITGKVRNTSDRASTAFVRFKMLRGDEVLGSVLCNSSELEPRQVETLNCIPDGEYSSSFGRVTAEAAF